VFADDEAAWIERRLEHGQCLSRFGFAAHKHVESHIFPFRPGMNADVTLGENGNTRDAASVGERMQVNVQQGCPGRLPEWERAELLGAKNKRKDQRRVSTNTQASQIG